MCVNDKGRGLQRKMRVITKRWPCALCRSNQVRTFMLHMCVRVATNVPFFPPNQPLVSHPRFLSFPFVLSRALSRSRCVIWANAVRHLCLSRCFSPVTPVYSIAMCASQRMIAIKSEQRCLGWAPVCWITKWLFGKKKKMLCYLFYKGKIWNIQNSVVFLGHRTPSPPNRYRDNIRWPKNDDIILQPVRVFFYFLSAFITLSPSD